MQSVPNATPATQNDIPHLPCQAKWHFHACSTLAKQFKNVVHVIQPWHCDSRKTRNATRLKCCACHAGWRWTRKMQAIFWKPCKSIVPVTQNVFRHFFRRMRMSRNATPAMQNDIGTSLKTFENERSCSFPHRHGDATRKPENRYETCGSLKTRV